MKIGKIIAIQFNKLLVRISTEIRGNSVNIQGRIYYFGNIGGYLKTFNAIKEEIVCEVTSIVDEDPNKENQSFNVESNRRLVLRPLGTIKDKKFALGVGIYPSLYSDVNILTYEDMELMLMGSINTQENKTQAEKEKKKHQSFKLGLSKSLINYPIHVNINNFFQIHSAVLGNTGSGKSNSIAHIIQQILSKESYSACGAKIILFDVNGEYKNAFQDIGKETKTGLTIKFYRPNIESSGEDDYQQFILPHFLLSLDEWCAFLLATEATQRPFWNRVLQQSYRFFALESAKQEDSTEDGGSTEPNQIDLIHYFIHHVCSMMQNVLGQVDSDNAMMTSARSLIGRLKDLIQKDKPLSCVSEINGADIDITYRVAKKEGKDGHKEEKTIKSLSISRVLDALMDATSLYYGDNKSVLSNLVTNILESVEKKRTQKVLDKKYRPGNWYSYLFLSIAADICLLEEDSRRSKNMRNWVSTMLTRLDYFLENHDCDFMRVEDGSIKDRESYLKNMFGVGDKADKCQLIIIDTSALPPDALEILTSVVARLIFDHRRSTGSERTKNPVHLILDEAHRYIKKSYEYLLKENIFEKIAREGRKYSYYLLISSQRPSELSETVLSQCGNYIVHRIQNEVDMTYVKRIMPFFSPDMDGRIKQATPGDAMVFGNCVPMPLHVAIEQASPEPSSKNCDISEEWFRDPKK